MTITFVRTLILYILITFSLRAMGKRQVGELSSSELVTTLLFSELAAIPMENAEIPLIYGIIPILTLLALEILVSSAFLKSRRLRKLTVGKTSIIIEDGKINQTEMHKLRLTLDELLEELRLKNFIDISQVKYAILESNGELSVFPFGTEQSATRADIGKNNDNMFLPHTIISDGVLIKSELAKMKKNENWVKKVLSKHSIHSYDEVFLMQYDEKDNVFVIPKEKKR